MRAGVRVRVRAGVSVSVRLRFRQRARVNAAVPRALGLTNLLTHSLSLTSLLAHHAEARHRIHLEQGGSPPGHGRRAL